MKKVTFLVGDLNSSGGTERVTSLVANKLIDLGYSISILSLVNGCNPYFDLRKNIEVDSLYKNKISFKKNYLNIIFKIRKYIKHNNIDTLIVVDSISCIFTVPALFGLNVNHICWEHFNFNVDLGVSYRNIGRKLAAKYCNYIVTLTKRDETLWQQGLKKINAKIIPISNPTPYEDIAHIPDLKYKTILSVGRLTHQKGFDLLIKAWHEVCKSNREWKLKIVGNGEEEENLKNQVSSFSLEERVEFITATKKIEEHYKTSSFYCMSSRYEGLPMVLLEAQSFGLPIVSFDCDTGPSDLILHKNNGYLCSPDNIKSLAEGLLYLMNISKINYLNMVNLSKDKSKDYKLENIINKWTQII